jgi:pilus assembly protein Flp/PilA
MLRILITSKLAIDRLIREDTGQGLTEYALILALIGVAAIVALSLVGGPTQGVLSTAGNSLARG